MPVVFNAATAANVNILRETNQLFQTAQKRVATGKNIFSASDEATRFTMSQSMLSRSKNLDSVNSNISTALKSIESTDKTLTQIRNLLGQMNDMATRALNAGAPTTVSAVGGTGAGILETTSVTGGSSNAKLSITSDNGRNFTYTFNSTNTNWGQVAQALNAANIGVTMRFQANGTGSQMVLESSDNSTGFTIDNSSSQSVMNQLGTALQSAYDGTYNASHFVNGTSTPSGFGGTVPDGMHFGLGGRVTTATFTASSVAAGSSLSFLGSDGVARTWSTASAKNLDAVLSEINAMDAGVKAEIVPAGGANMRIALRNTAGGSMTVLNGTGAFDSSAAGNMKFNTTIGQPVVVGNPVAGSSNAATALLEGKNFENYKLEITSLINNNVTQSGRNLLTGQNVSIILNEFSANAITVSGVATAVGGNLALTTLGTNWNTSANITSSQTQVKAAMQTVDKLQAQFGTYSSFVRERFDMNQSFASELKSLGDDLVAADVAEESAKLTALQTQQQFAVQAFTAGSQNSQALLRLLG